MRLPPTLLLLLLLTAPAFAQKKRIKLPEELKEVSGMVRMSDGILWMHNDSRNPSILFRFDPINDLIVEKRTLPIPNRDWEDITTDPFGKLYIGDFGNNGNARKNLRIYTYQPADQAFDSILFTYPDQKAFPPSDERDWNFNCEAMVFWKDSLHLFSKNAFKGNFVCKHYVLPAKPGSYNALLRDSMVIPKHVITGAALIADGQTLALTGYVIGKKWGFIPISKASIMFFSDAPEGHFLKGKFQKQKLPKCFVARQYESVTMVEDGVWLVANEGRGPQRQSLWRVSKKR